MKPGLLFSWVLLLGLSTTAFAGSHKWSCTAEVRDPSGYIHHAFSDNFLDSRDGSHRDEVQKDFAQFLMSTFPVQGAGGMSWINNPDTLGCNVDEELVGFNSEAVAQIIREHNRNPEIKFVTFASPHPPTNTRLASQAPLGSTKSQSAGNAGDGFAYRNNLNKCVHFNRDHQNLWYDNTCNASLTVIWYQKPRTSDAGWGSSDCAPSSRCDVGAAGMGYNKSDNIAFAACPKGFDIVLPSGNQWAGNGTFRCRTLLVK